MLLAGRPLNGKNLFTVTALAGIIGSDSGGMSIALATMADCVVSAAQTADVPLEVLDRNAAMASGAMATLAHNVAVIRLRTPRVITRQEVT